MEDDPRLAAYARLLVERCIDPQPGWQVLVQTTSVARPLAEQLSRSKRIEERLDALDRRG